MLQNSALLKQYQDGELDKRKVLEALKKEVGKSSVIKELRGSIQRVLYKETGQLPLDISTEVNNCAKRLQSKKEQDLISKEETNQVDVLAPGGALIDDMTSPKNRRKRVLQELFGEISSGDEKDSETEWSDSDDEKKKTDPNRKKKKRPSQTKTRVGVKTLFDAGYLHQGDKLLFRNTKKESTAIINGEGLIEWINPIDQTIHKFQFVSQFSTAVDRNLEPIGSLGSSHNGWNNTYLVTDQGEHPVRDVRDRYMAHIEQHGGVVKEEEEEDDDKRSRVPTDVTQGNEELERYKSQVRNRNK
jgi:hypothetical protein